MKTACLLLASMLSLSSVLASSTTTSNNTLNLQSYGIVPIGENVTIERKMLEQAKQLDGWFPADFEKLLESKANKFEFTPDKIVELALCGTTDEERENILTDLQNSDVLVSCSEGGLISIEPIQK